MSIKTLHDLKSFDSLWGLQVSVDDLVEVQVVHSPGNAHGPVHEQAWLDLPACPQHLIQLPLCTVLHDDAVTRSLRANASARVQKDAR